MHAEPFCIRRPCSGRIAATATATIIFAVSRLTPLKRFDLLIRALAEPAAAGRALRHRRRRRGGAERFSGSRASWVSHDRVQLVGRIDEASLLEHLARCRAVAFLPHDEDYGFVTVEAFASRSRSSPVPTAAVRPSSSTDGVNGLVCPADARRAGGGDADADGRRARAQRLGRGRLAARARR